MSEQTFTTHLTHLELKKTPLLLHLLCNFRPGDLGADHPMLLGVLSLLLLYLCTGAEERAESLHRCTPLFHLFFDFRFVFYNVALCAKRLAAAFDPLFSSP